MVTVAVLYSTLHLRHLSQRLSAEVINKSIHDRKKTQDESKVRSKPLKLREGERRLADIDKPRNLFY